MVSKQCVVCGDYFAGELNGDYSCPACQRMGAAQRMRPLASLGDFGRADAAVSATGAAKPPAAPPRSTKGQAA